MLDVSKLKPGDRVYYVGESAIVFYGNDNGPCLDLNWGRPLIVANYYDDKVEVTWPEALGNTYPKNKLRTCVLDVDRVSLALDGD